MDHDHNSPLVTGKSVLDLGSFVKWAIFPVMPAGHAVRLVFETIRDEGCI